ncbi:MAG: hypothetical protein U0572_00060 [Phycisphaerales bacterium]
MTTLNNEASLPAWAQGIFAERSDSSSSASDPDAPTLEWGTISDAAKELAEAVRCRRRKADEEAARHWAAVTKLKNLTKSQARLQFRGSAVPDAFRLVTALTICDGVAGFVDGLSILAVMLRRLNSVAQREQALKPYQASFLARSPLEVLDWVSVFPNVERDGGPPIFAAAVLNDAKRARGPVWIEFERAVAQQSASQVDDRLAELRACRDALHTVQELLAAFEPRLSWSELLRPEMELLESMASLVRAAARREDAASGSASKEPPSTSARVESRSEFQVSADAVAAARRARIAEIQAAARWFREMEPHSPIGSLVPEIIALEDLTFQHLMGKAEKVKVFMEAARSLREKADGAAEEAKSSS